MILAVRLSGKLIAVAFFLDIIRYVSGEVDYRNWMECETKMERNLNNIISWLASEHFLSTLHAASVHEL